MADINTIAKQFVDFYYNTFAGNRKELISLYVRSLFSQSRPKSRLIRSIE